MILEPGTAQTAQNSMQIRSAQEPNCSFQRESSSNSSLSGPNQKQIDSSQRFTRKYHNKKKNLAD